MYRVHELESLFWYSELRGSPLCQEMDGGNGVSSSCPLCSRDFPQLEPEPVPLLDPGQGRKDWPRGSLGRLNG